jgi:hypothetical protein
VSDFTADDLNNLLVGWTKSIGGGLAFKEQAPRIECADGFSVSVQASKTHYSTPRSDDGPYTHVECGFARYPEGASPVAPAVEVTCVDESDVFARFDARRRAHRHEYVFVGEWREWAEDDCGDTVFGYVPVDVVVAWINAHGGVAVDATADSEARP